MSEISMIRLLGADQLALFAFYGNMRQVKVKLIDSLPQLLRTTSHSLSRKSIPDVYPDLPILIGEELSTA